MVWKCFLAPDTDPIVRVEDKINRVDYMSSQSYHIQKEWAKSYTKRMANILVQSISKLYREIIKQND